MVKLVVGVLSILTVAGFIFGYVIFTFAGR